MAQVLTKPCPKYFAGEFLEIDMEHAHFIDPQELNEAIKGLSIAPKITSAPPRLQPYMADHAREELPARGFLGFFRCPVAFASDCVFFCVRRLRGDSVLHA